MTSKEVIDQEIRDALSSATPDGRFLDPDPVAAVRQRMSARRTRRRRGIALAGVGVVAVVAFASFSIIDIASEPEDVEATDRRPTTTDSPLVPPPSTPSTTADPPLAPPPSTPGDGLSNPPLDVRGDAAVVWSGREVVVWGGDVEAANMGLPGADRSYADGAAFNPTTGTWRRMSDSPLPRSAATTRGVKVDRGIVFVRERSTALWDPETDTWQELEDAPAPVSDLSSTGREAISFSANALLDSASGTWTTLPEPPRQLERPTSVWDGNEFVVIGGPSTPFTDARAIAFNPERGQWRTLPDPPDGLTAAALSADWDGERVIVVNYDMRAAAYDPNDESWTALPDVPARFSEWQPTLRSNGQYSVAFMAVATVVLIDGERWVPLPNSIGSNGPAVSADGPNGFDAVYTFGFDSDEGKNILSVIQPSSAESPDQIQIGIFTADLPEQASIVSTSLVAGTPAPGENVEVELSTTTGTCKLIAGNGTEPIPAPVSAPLNQLAWTRNEAGITWRLSTSFTDALRIDCADSDTARAVAASVIAP